MFEFSFNGDIGNEVKDRRTQAQRDEDKRHENYKWVTQELEKFSKPEEWGRKKVDLSLPPISELPPI